MALAPFIELVAAQKRGQAQGMTSICSANPLVIEASLRHALAGTKPVLIESTCNQVNQFGGYTGMTPSEFVAFVTRIAQTLEFPIDRLLLGGDHLGPSPWQQEPAAQAMTKADALVRDYVQAGYAKIHLDASMKCADDDPARPLAPQVSARRAAVMARAAEEAAAERDADTLPVYVIGTEVPVPGGLQEDEVHVSVTNAADVAETISITHQAFLNEGLADAWTRVIAVVAQPGVEFGDTLLAEYDPTAAQGLARLIEDDPQLIFEAHSTDYQTPDALKNLVADHFAILKVGPALTFALREAVFSLAMMEEALLADRAGASPSHVREALEGAMLANPAAWAKYYGGDAADRAFARRYSFSDRIRYYWPAPSVQAALAQLFANLGDGPLPLSLLSQYAPAEYRAIRAEIIDNAPHAIVMHHIQLVLDEYARACYAESPASP